MPPYLLGNTARHTPLRISMSDRAQVFDTVTAQIAPFNKKGVALTDATTFQGDLEWDSLTVMDFVAAIEDEFDIIITMNMQAEIETVGQLVDAVMSLKA
jgi:acyl carrier protein